MEEDFDDDLAEEGLPTGHDAVAPGKGILLLPHRQLHPHSQLLKARPSVDQEPRVAILPPHATHSHLGGQDHGEWTYEEQFRQVGFISTYTCRSCHLTRSGQLQVNGCCYWKLSHVKVCSFE